MTVKQQVCGRESPRSLDVVRLALLGSPSGARCGPHCVAVLASPGIDRATCPFQSRPCLLCCRPRYGGWPNWQRGRGWKGPSARRRRPTQALRGRCGERSAQRGPRVERSGASPSRILNSFHESLRRFVDIRETDRERPAHCLYHAVAGQRATDTLHLNAYRTPLYTRTPLCYKSRTTLSGQEPPRDAQDSKTVGVTGSSR